MTNQKDDGQARQKAEEVVLKEPAQFHSDTFFKSYFEPAVIREMKLQKIEKLVGGQSLCTTKKHNAVFLAQILALIEGGK